MLPSYGAVLEALYARLNAASGVPPRAPQDDVEILDELFDELSAPLEEVKEECPQELRPIIFLHCRYHEDDGGSLKAEGERFAKDREVVKWMRVKELQRVRENVALFAQAPPRLSGSSTES